MNWSALLAVLGVPVEVDSPGLNRLPLLTWMIAVVCVGIFVVSLCCGIQREVVDIGGFIPAQWFRYCGMNIFSAMFIHASWGHLIGNMAFLLVFGDNVEDLLGRKKFILFILLAGVCSQILHLLFTNSSQIPCVGASGFISGIIAFYTVVLPQVKLRCFVRLHPVDIPVWFWFVLWIGGQILSALFLANSNVAYFAHIGGALCGFFAGVYCRRKMRNQGLSAEAAFAGNGNR